MRPLRLFTSIVLLTTLLALGVSGTSPAGAAGIGITIVRDLVVDEPHGRVFVSGGSLVATDLAGKQAMTIPAVAGARAMTLTPDGDFLVVAVADGIAVVDPVTASVVRTIQTGASSCPEAVAAAAGKIFFSHGDCAGGTPGLGAVDLADDAVTLGIATDGLVLKGSPNTTNTTVLMESVAAAPTVLVVAAGGQVAVLDVTADVVPTATVRASRAFSNIPQDLAVNPEGTEVVAVGGSDGVSAFATADLALVRTYGPSTAKAMDFRADGRLGVALFSNGVLGVYRPGSVQQATVRVGSRNEIARRGIGYGSVYLYAVVRSLDTDANTVVVTPVGPPPKLTITTDKSAYDYRTTATVTITLGAPTLSRTVSLYARAYGRDLRLIKTAAVGASSRKLVVKVPYLTYNTNFLVKFAGDEDYAPTSAIRSVKVRAKVVITSPSRSVVNGYHRLDNSPAPSLTVSVYPAHPNQCVRISGEILVNGVWRSLSGGEYGSCVRTTSASRLAVKLINFRPGDRVKVYAKYSNGGTSGPILPGGAGNIDSPTAVYGVIFY